MRARPHPAACELRVCVRAPKAVALVLAGEQSWCVFAAQRWLPACAAVALCVVALGARLVARCPSILLAFANSHTRPVGRGTKPATRESAQPAPDHGCPSRPLALSPSRAAPQARPCARPCVRRHFSPAASQAHQPSSRPAVQTPDSRALPPPPADHAAVLDHEVPAHHGRSTLIRTERSCFRRPASPEVVASPVSSSPSLMRLSIT